MDEKKAHFIDGVWMAGGEPFASTNPANDEVLWEGQEADAATVDLAVEAAKRAFGPWSRLDYKIRVRHLEAFQTKLEEEKQNLALAISKENGKPLWDALIEVGTAINKVKITIEAYDVRCAEIRKELPTGTSITKHRPHGVMAVLGPFNFPIHIPNGHIAPALLAGNTIVFKPSEITPYAAELMVRCWEESGLPKGVINLVQGGRTTGEALIKNPAVDGILFTGSWDTGVKLAEAMAPTPFKILALEMGGNNPLIVSQVKNIDAAALITIQSAYLTSGQRCTCARRLIIIEGSQQTKFMETLTAQVKEIQVGPYSSNPEPFMGPLIHAKAAQKLLAAQKNLVALGGVSIIPLQQLSHGPAFLSPGIIDMTDVKDHPDEELFGPLLQVYRVANLQTAVEEANRTAYGLTSGIITDSRDEFDYFYRMIRAGLANWNVPTTGASSAAPFGGIGRSGNNRPSAFYAADYCAYPVASIEAAEATMPQVLPPGLKNER